MKQFLVVAVMMLWCNFGWAQSDNVGQLTRVLEEQARQIEQLQDQVARLERLVLKDSVVQPAVLTIAQPVQAAQAPVAPQQGPAQPAGIRLSGDFRLRLDAAFRSQAVQNVRQRYRLRLNADRDVFPDLGFHMQLSTGAVNNGITLDQDFAGGVTRHPFLISEAYMDYHPNPNFSVRAGKIPEIYADNSRFLWDDDVRFNGFNERLRRGNVELRAGQYFFVNPNTYSVSPTSPLTSAGVQAGKIARAGQMFHQGITVTDPINARWRQQLTTDAQVYRNPNLIALTSNAVGATVTVNPAIGLTLSGPAPGAGSATTAPGNAILFARHYQVVRAAYQLDATQLGGNARLPFTWMIQASRNVGTSQLRDAILSTVSIGRTDNPGEVRGLYTFAIKDANSLISQLTDDDLGTGIGTNLATHHFRMDYAVRRNVVFQNLLFMQTERRSSNPAAGFFVPLGREAPRTWRFQGQLAISF